MDKWCFGLEKLKFRAREYPLEKVSAITWIPKEKIYEVTRLYARAKSATIYSFLDIMQQVNSTQTARAVIMLSAITGNIDVLGGNLLTQKRFRLGLW